MLPLRAAPCTICCHLQSSPKARQRYTTTSLVGRDVSACILGGPEKANCYRNISKSIILRSANRARLFCGATECGIRKLETEMQDWKTREYPLWEYIHYISAHMVRAPCLNFFARSRLVELNSIYKLAWPSVLGYSRSRVDFYVAGYVFELCISKSTQKWWGDALLKSYNFPGSYAAATSITNWATQ